MVFRLCKGAFLGLGLFLVGCASPEGASSPEPLDLVNPTPVESEQPTQSFPPLPNLEEIVANANPECTDNGCVQDVHYVGSYDKTTVTQWLPYGVNIQNGYSVWLVHYATHGKQARATITLPLDVQYPSNGFHVILNNPLTVGVASRCAPGDSAGGAGLAAQFGTQGIVGVAIDYPGLGSAGTHPYLVAESEGMAALDGARAALSFLEYAKVPHSNRLAMTGLSQGGHATLSAAALHESYAPELDIRAFAAAAPSNLFLEFWSPYINTDGAHLTFYALVALAWSHHYGYPTDPIFYAPRRAEIEDAILSLCLIEAEGETLWDKLGTSAENIFTEQFREAFSNGDFTDFPAFELGFIANRLVPFEQTAPIKIYQGTWDYTVPPESTQILIQSLQEAGMDIQYEEIPLATHLNTAFGYIVTYQLAGDSSLHWLNGQLNAEN
jgi:hypothetical protein